MLQCDFAVFYKSSFFIDQRGFRKRKELGSWGGGQPEATPTQPAETPKQI